MSHRSAPAWIALLGGLATLSSACSGDDARAPTQAAAGAPQEMAGAGPVAGSASTSGGTAASMGGTVAASGSGGLPPSAGTGGAAGSGPLGGGEAGGAAGTAGAPSLVPDPTAGGWQLNEYSMIVDGALELTPGRDDTDGHERGTAFWPTPLESDGLHIEFDVDITPRKDHGDGMTLAFADPSAGAQVTDFGDSGGGLGYTFAPCCPGIKGPALAIDTSKNANDPNGNFLGVATGGQIDKLTWAVTETDGIPNWVGTPHHIGVTVAGGTLAVTVDGSEVLRTNAGTPTIPAQVLLGFTGANGTGKSRQLVKNLVVSRK